MPGICGQLCIVYKIKASASVYTRPRVVSYDFISIRVEISVCAKPRIVNSLVHDRCQRVNLSVARKEKEIFFVRPLQDWYTGL